MRLRIQWFRVDGRRIREKKKRLLDSRTKTTTRMKFDLNFFRVFSENRYPENLHRTLESPENLTLLSSLKEVKPSPDHNLIKLVTFNNSFPPLRLLANTRTRMTTAITFSRQNDAGLTLEQYSRLRKSPSRTRFRPQI